MLHLSIVRPDNEVEPRWFPRRQVPICDRMRWRPIISILAGFAATWPFAAHGQELMPLTHGAINPPRIEMVRVKQIGLLAPNVQMRLRDGEIDLLKPSDLGGSDGIGSAWKMPSVTKFQERFGQW